MEFDWINPWEPPAFKANWVNIMGPVSGKMVIEIAMALHEKVIIM